MTEKPWKVFEKIYIEFQEPVNIKIYSNIGKESVKEYIFYAYQQFEYNDNGQKIDAIGKPTRFYREIYYERGQAVIQIKRINYSNNGQTKIFIFPYHNIKNIRIEEN